MEPDDREKCFTTTETNSTIQIRFHETLCMYVRAFIVDSTMKSIHTKNLMCEIIMR